MKTRLTLALAATAILASGGVAFAAGHSGAAPGQEMQRGAPSGESGPGASGYAPGHEMQENGRGSGGASQYAPGHSTTGESSESRDRDTRDRNMMRREHEK